MNKKCEYFFQSISVGYHAVISSAYLKTVIMNHPVAMLYLRYFDNTVEQMPH
jgi:hypothetical protein